MSSTRDPSKVLRSGCPRIMSVHQLLQVGLFRVHSDTLLMIANTVLSSSFNKEELAGENGDCISLEASQRGQEKISVLRELAHDVSLCVSRVANILEGSGPMAQCVS